MTSDDSAAVLDELLEGGFVDHRRTVRLFDDPKQTERVLEEAHLADD
jgi:hypothetical protein